MIHPIITIIIPCYNAEKFLRETLDCLPKQTLKNWECVIVNDGSTDGSLSIMKEYAHNDCRYTYIDKKNEGPAIARNTAIAASHGKYILPLDADDLIAPTYTEKAVAYLENHADTKLVYCEAMFFGAKNKKWELKPYYYDDLLWGNLIFCSAVYRREDFDKTIGYNPNMRGGNEDWDFWLTFLKKEDKVYRIPEVLFFYRRHGNTRTTTATQQMVNLNKIMIRNHYELYEPFIDMLLNYKWMADELERLYNSKTYKIGNFIMCPFRWIKMQLEKRNWQVFHV